MSLDRLWFDPAQVYVDGRWRAPEGGGRLALEDPSTGQGIGEIAGGQAADIDAAVAAARAALSGTTPLLLPLFSPRSAGLIAPEIANANAPLHIAAMSPAVVEALPLQARGGAVTAPTPDAEGMLRALAELLQRVKSA